jgi:hypothetical protein
MLRGSLGSGGQASMLFLWKEMGPGKVVRLSFLLVYTHRRTRIRRYIRLMGTSF